MAWSKGVDFWVNDLRALSAKTTYEGAGVGEVMINSVGGENTRLHCGFDVTNQQTSVWGTLTDAGTFAGHEQRASVPISALQPLGELHVDLRSRTCQLSLNVSSAATATPTSLAEAGGRVQVAVRAGETPSVTYILGVTSDRSLAEAIAGDPTNAVVPLHGGDRPVWLGFMRMDQSNTGTRHSG